MAKGNWRDELDRKLFAVLRNEGTRSFLSLAQSMLNVDPGGDGMLKAQFVGEVCECVQWGLTKQYIRTMGVEAQIFHSVVLKDLKRPKSDFRTELDALLVTPYFLLTTECKSYSGGIRVTDKCTFRHKGQHSDIYAQSKLHFDKLVDYAEQLALPNLRLTRMPVMANAFVFSNSEIVDQRTEQNRMALSVHTTSTLLDYYDRLFRAYKTPVYDYERACKIFGTLSRSKKLHAQHGEYLGYGGEA